MHDWCYDSAHCPMFLEYFVPYLWKCYRGRPRCGKCGPSASQSARDFGVCRPINEQDFPRQSAEAFSH